MKANKYFDIEELVPEEIFEEFGEDSLKFIKKDALLMLENIREILNVPLICNNWNTNGDRNYCGYRQKNCPIGAKLSQHKEGNAFDLISKKLTAKEMRDILSKNQDKLKFRIRIEKWNKGKEISWLHVDLKEHNSKDKIYFFKA